MKSEITKSSKEYESLKIRSSSLSEGKDYDELKTLLYDMLAWMNNIVEIYEQSTDDLKDELTGTIHQLKDVQAQVRIIDVSLKQAKESQLLYLKELDSIKRDSESNKRRLEKMVDNISSELKKCKRVKKRDPYEGI